jgi:hypothetical protein
MIKNNKLRPKEERIDVHEVGLKDSHEWIVLKGTERARMGKYHHEVAKADLYVAFHNHCDNWRNEFPLGGGLLQSDITMVFQGTRFHIEVDMGNMEPEDLYSKVERYRQLAGSGERVIFILADGKYKASYIGSSLMNYFNEQRLGNFCSATLLENITRFPLGDVINSPLNGRISISQLCASS